MVLRGAMVFQNTIAPFQHKCNRKPYTAPWHYIDVNDQTWNKNIEERNCRVLNGEGGSDYYLDEGGMDGLT